MDKYAKMKNTIENAGDIACFAPYGEGSSEEWIKKAEERLKIHLPESYKWWLMNYGGGEIAGDEIYSIYEMDFDTSKSHVDNEYPVYEFYSKEMYANDFFDFLEKRISELA